MVLRSLKAVLLAGGRGERARPFSDVVPKVMIPVLGRPVIDYIVRHLASFELIEEIVVVCANYGDHSLQIRGYFEGKTGLSGGKLSFVEETVGGTGGALLSARGSLEGEDDFLVWFGDNLVPLDVGAFYRFHDARDCFGTVAVSSLKRSETGFVEVGRDGRVLRFKEKPVVRLEEPECLGVYLFDSKILDYVEAARGSGGNVNLSFDVLEGLPSRERLYCFDIGSTEWIDVESPAKVTRNIEAIRKILGRMAVSSD